MKTIRELRTVLKFKPEEANSSIKYFAENVNIDFDVFLPSKGFNLQRDFVWNIDQKRELIWSLLMKRNIPRIALVNVLKDPKDIDGTYQVIDGKQRLSTMIDFYKGKFDLEIDDKTYLFNELPQDYQNVISGFMFSYYIVNEDFDNKISDDDKIDWFKFINFSGTPQDKDHLNKLTK